LRDGWARNLHPEDRERVYSEWYRTAKDNLPFKSEYRFVRPGGVTTWVLGEATAEVSKTGEVMGYVGTITDITDRKRAEELTRASLKEKEELLNEVHHRVKNNLQIISSLLDMRSMRTSNQEAIDLFTDARSKINAMSLIHSALYRSDRFDQICLEEHTRKLVEFLLYIYARGKDVTFDIKQSDVHLPVSQAIPCALVLNELVSNALKHGYREGQKGAIEISISRLPGEAVSIRVKDDGAGIPAEIDIFNVDSLGLKLVRNLVQKQLNGKIRVERNGGTEFTIEFPLLHKDVSKEGVKNA
ncbi:MAG: histidine kinase dimerization/phosphoacceptor domain -containing protein, partial [Candidatus Brocadiales bacterium]